MYSPGLGRFMQTDPPLVFGCYADGPNQYAYVGNDPMNGIDPTGLSTIVVRAPRIPGEGCRASGGVFVIRNGTAGCASRAEFRKAFGGLNIPTLQIGGGGGGSGGLITVRGKRNQSDQLVGLGHDYIVHGFICSSPMNNHQMRNVLSRFSLPGRSGQRMGNGNYWVYQWGIPGGRVNVTFARDGLSVRNTTRKLHVFAGQVDRRIYASRFGTFTTTRGTGTAELMGDLRDYFNELLGPGIFEGLDEDARAYAQNNFSGC